MLSYHFFNQTSRGNFFTDDTAHGAGQVWSNIPHNPMFEEYNVPLPLVVACSRPSGSKLAGYTFLNMTVYEVRYRYPKMGFGADLHLGPTDQSV